MSTHAVNQLASWMLEHPSIDDVTTVSRPGTELSTAAATAVSTATATGTALAGVAVGRGAEVRPCEGDIWWTELYCFVFFQSKRCWHHIFFRLLRLLCKK